MSDEVETPIIDGVQFRSVFVANIISQYWLSINKVNDLRFTPSFFKEEVRENVPSEVLENALDAAEMIWNDKLKYLSQ